MRREDQAVIGRLYSVAPRDLDRFYLRLLLLHTPNATGYVGAGALKPTSETTWRAAAEQRGLVETDEEFDLLLLDASLTHLPRSLRDLFVQVLIHGEPSEPQKLWEKHAGELSQDYVRKALTPDSGFDAALHDIDLLLQSHGKTTTDFGLPEPSLYDAEVFQNRALRQALDFDVDKADTAAAEMLPKLNETQQSFFDAVVEALGKPEREGGSRAFFWTDQEALEKPFCTRSSSTTSTAKERSLGRVPSLALRALCFQVVRRRTLSLSLWSTSGDDQVRCSIFH